MSTDEASKIAALNARIENLEMKYSYQEQLVEELSKIVREQSEKLGLVVSKVREIATEIKDAGSVDSKPVKPPHY